MLTEVSPQEGLAIAQDVFEQVPRAHLTAHPLAQLHAGVTLESFDQNADGVDCVLLDRATRLRSTVRTPYLIAADGWRSAVRTRLGIDVSGPDDMGSMRAITFRADLTP